APFIGEGLTSGSVALGVHLATAACALVTIGALIRRRFALARVSVALQASFIVWGWAWSQFPYLLPPTVPITAVSAPSITLSLTLWALGIGTVILFPSFVYLFRVFKGHGTSFQRIERSDRTGS
ncbi:MAG: cytochrome d ubiquinol oxidase subunit II, partial [Gemmatimonadaceae bacterium]|nr:cytochrome d ubiquinol oxidase subunit II [Gemmatimonadaceae bacterium]